MKKKITVKLVKYSSVSSRASEDLPTASPYTEYYEPNFIFKETKKEISIIIDISAWELAGNLENADSNGYGRATEYFTELINGAIDVLQKKKIAVDKDCLDE